MEFNILLANDESGNEYYEIDEDHNIYHYPNRFETLGEAKEALEKILDRYSTPKKDKNVVYTAYQISQI